MMNPQRVSAFAVLAIGCSAMIGWAADITLFRQVRPDWVPMQGNTALDFILLGFALLVIAVARSAADIAATLVAIITAATAAEYLGATISIDEMLFKHTVTVHSANPGRMAPNTALSGMVASLSIMSYRSNPRLSSLLCVLLWMLSNIAIAGYVLDIESAYGWGKLTAMAAHTAVAFQFVAISLATLPSNKAALTGMVRTVAGKLRRLRQ